VALSCSIKCQTPELLNVDGDCGGYNLLFAWASGITAARAALNTVHAESS
jgi:predicted flavoprotein YhiN